MAPSPLNVPPSSPAINIQNTDRYPASPWNEFDTDWKFPPPDADAPNSNPYTPSYNSFNSWGSPSASWGGREGSDPINMYEDQDFAMDAPRVRARDDATYDPAQYDGDIVGDMDEFPAPTPALSFTPAFDTFPPPVHSPSFSANSANSSPRSRASSTSSLHAPTSDSPPGGISSRSFNAAMSFPQSPKATSPPALVIPDDPPQSSGATQAQQQQSGLGVSIHIVPSTPVVPPPQGQHDPHQRFSGAPPLPHAHSDPGQQQLQQSEQHLQQLQQHQQQYAFFGQHRQPQSNSAASSPAFSPRLDLDQHSPRTSGDFSVHASPHSDLGRPDLSPSPRHGEFLLPEADPGVPRPRSASENAWPAPGLGLYSGTVDPSDVHPPLQYAHTNPNSPHLSPHHPYDNPHLHPHTASAGGVFSGTDTFFGTGGSASVRRVKSDAATHHRRGVKSEDLRVPPSSHLSSDFFPRYSQTGAGDLLRPPTAGGLGLRDVSGGKQRRGHDRHASLGSAVRTSPYPSPKASPAHRGGMLPDIGGTSVFDTFGAPGAGPEGTNGGLNTTNPPRKLVTTKATHDASSARRKNEPGFVCPVPGCGSTFTRSFNLKGHLRSHNEERPFKCKWPGCEKGFARQHDCKRHEALHLNIRPYTCAGCKKTFARMDALNRHRGADCSGHEQTMQDHHQQQQHQHLMGRAGNLHMSGHPNGPSDLDTGLIM